MEDNTRIKNIQKKKQTPGVPSNTRDTMTEALWGKNSVTSFPEHMQRYHSPPVEEDFINWSRNGETRDYTTRCTAFISSRTELEFVEKYKDATKVLKIF